MSLTYHAIYLLKFSDNVCDISGHLSIVNKVENELWSILTHAKTRLTRLIEMMSQPNYIEFFFVVAGVVDFVVVVNLLL